MTLLATALCLWLQIQGYASSPSTNSPEPKSATTGDGRHGDNSVSIPSKKAVDNQHPSNDMESGTTQTRIDHDTSVGHGDADPLYLELVVNEIPTGKIVPVKREGGRYYVFVSDLAGTPVMALISTDVKQAGMEQTERSLSAQDTLQVPIRSGAADIDPSTSGQARGASDRNGNAAKEEMFDLTSLHQVTVAYDAGNQRLRLNLPSDPGDRQVVGSWQREYIPSRTSFGVVTNYDSYFSHSQTGNSFFSNWTELRSFGNWGNVSNTGISRYSVTEAALPHQTLLPHDPLSRTKSATNIYTRFDTQWTLVDETRMNSYSAGDLITRSLHSGSSVRIGGISFGRNFRLRPDVIPYPIPSIIGTASVPTSLDVVINGAKLIEQQVQPGPYVVQGIPVINGAGSATVVATDALGRQVENTVSFYVANELLREGLTDFAISAGWLRHGYGQQSLGYRSLVASGMFRYGLSNALTVNAQSEVASGLFVGSGGVDALVGRWGVLSAMGSGSWCNGHKIPADASGSASGYRFSLGYQYNTGRFRIQARQGFRDAHYRDLATQRGDGSMLLSANARSTSEGILGLTPWSAFGTLSGGYFALRGDAGKGTRIANITYSRNLLRHTTAYLIWNRSLTDRQDTTLQAQLVVSLGKQGTFSVGVAQDHAGNYRGRVQHTRAVAPRGGVGWNAGYSTGANNGDFAEQSAHNLDVTWRHRAIQLRGGLFGQASQTTGWAAATGSLIWMGGQVFTANRIDDAFAVVDVSGQPQVPVSFENQEMGRSNRRGFLLIPWIASHYAGKIAINPMDLPLDATPDLVEERFVIRRKSGALIRFPIRTTTALHLRLVGADGEPLSLGLHVLHRPTGLRTVVGWDGMVYLELPALEGSLQVSLEDNRTCIVTLGNTPPRSGNGSNTAAATPRTETCR